MFNKNVSELLRTPWAIDPQTAHSWLPWVANILTGKTSNNLEEIKKEAQVDATCFIVDENGNKFSSMEMDEIPPGSVGVVHIAGPMIKYGNWCAWGADELMGFAKEFDNHPNVIGQIWNIDSGGGAVNAVAPYQEFLSTKSKPVYAVADTCASAAIWVGASCDMLFAENNISAMFGSIGVMATLVDYRAYLEEMGVKEHHIYASLSSYKNKDYHDALEGKYETFIKEHLDPLAIKFQSSIKSNRSKLDLNVEGILEGRMFYAEEAATNGLIDGIATMSEVVEMLKTRSSAQLFMNS